MRSFVGAAGDEMEAPPLEARTGGKSGDLFRDDGRCWWNYFGGSAFSAGFG